MTTSNSTSHNQLSAVQLWPPEGGHGAAISFAVPFGRQVVVPLAPEEAGAILSEPGAAEDIRLDDALHELRDARQAKVAARAGIVAAFEERSAVRPALARDPTALAGLLTGPAADRIGFRSQLDEGVHRARRLDVQAAARLRRAEQGDPHLGPLGRIVMRAFGHLADPSA